MSIDPDNYVRKQFPVRAKQVTFRNIVEVAKWCGGTVCRPSGKTPYISAEIIGATNDRQTRAILGDWVVFMSEENKSNETLKFYTNSAFHRTFVKKKEETETEDLSPFDADTSRMILQHVSDLKDLLCSTL